LVTAFDEPALGGVYKLTAVRDSSLDPWTYKLKLSEQVNKASIPGVLQVRRYDSGSEFLADVLYDEQMGIGSAGVVIDATDVTRQKHIPSETRSTDLLVPVFRAGKRVMELPTLVESRQYAADQLNRLHAGIKRLIHPHEYPAGLSRNLFELRNKLVLKLKEKQ
jgi:nicotinate phosphoribosyltransferase